MFKIYLGNAEIYRGLFFKCASLIKGPNELPWRVLHLQWHNRSRHRVLKLTPQFVGIGGAIGYPLLSNAFPPGGRALLMKPLQQPIARDCLLTDDSVSSLSPLFINDISTHHQYLCSPATQTQPVEKRIGAEQCF